MVSHNKNLFFLDNREEMKQNNRENQGAKQNKG
jgi:hypothetical protein